MCALNMVNTHFGDTCSAVALGGFVFVPRVCFRIAEGECGPLLRLQIGTTFLSTDPLISRFVTDLEALGAACSASRLAHVCDTSVLEFG